MNYFYLFLPYIIAIIVLFTLLKVSKKMFKFILRPTLYSVIGAVIIILINLLCKPYHFEIGLNMFTSMFVGLLGIPGILTLFVFIKYVI